MAHRRRQWRSRFGGTHMRYAATGTLTARIMPTSFGWKLPRVTRPCRSDAAPRTTYPTSSASTVT